MAQIRTFEDKLRNYYSRYSKEDLIEFCIDLWRWRKEGIIKEHSLKAALQLQSDRLRQALKIKKTS